MNTRIRLVLAMLSACFAGCSGGGGGDKVDPAIVVGPISGATTEAGSQASFTVALTAKPSADVTITLASSDPSEGTVTPASFVFTALNFEAPQTATITGQDDDAADGAVTYSIELAAPTSTDARYSAINPPDVPVVNVDDETAGITVSPVSGATTENAGIATFSVVLNSQPSADVTVNFSSNDLTEGVTLVPNRTFTSVNWNAPQMVTITGVNDALADGSITYAIAFGATTSADAAYAAITPPSVPITNVDDDTAGITVTPISGATTENAGTATFSVVLNSQPIANVTVSFNSTDLTEGTTSVQSILFTSVNWNAPQTVTVTGVNDGLADGSSIYAIAFGATTSADAAYAAITPPNVPVTNIDNDTAGILVSAPSGATTESAGQASFSIVLTSQPTADVTVNFDTSDAGEGTPNVTSHTFTTANYGTAQTVMIMGVDDAVADGNQPYAITFGATTSADAAYATITPANVPLTNTDNDSAGITVGAISGPTSEGTGTATFTVVLNSQPTANVAVNFNSNDGTEGTVAVTSLTFTDLDWNMPQSVVVTGVDDGLPDGDQPYAVVFSATGSGDAAYAAITPPNVLVTNLDDDDDVAGYVADVSGNWDPVVTVPCGDGTNSNCTKAVAGSSCTAIGKRLVSHASDGSASVVSLGATSSCFWSISYFMNVAPAASGQCLIGVSNADWSSCCTTANWHGNIVPMPTVAGQQFGFVDSATSGYNASLSNVSGTTWGCIPTSSAPPPRAGCSTYYVACK